MRRACQQVLFWGFLFQILLGLSVALAYDSALWAWHRQAMAAALWGADEIPAVARPIVAQLGAMLGATMACWALAMAWLVAGPLRRGEHWAWGCITASALTWFVIDTAMSTLHGVWINVGFNVVAMTWMGVPLAVLRPRHRGPAVPRTEMSPSGSQPDCYNDDRP